MVSVVPQSLTGAKLMELFTTFAIFAIIPLTTYRLLASTHCFD